MKLYTLNYDGNEVANSTHTHTHSCSHQKQNVSAKLTYIIMKHLRV